MPSVTSLYKHYIFSPGKPAVIAGDSAYSIDSGLNRDFTCSTSSFVAFEAGT